MNCEISEWTDIIMNTLDTDRKNLYRMNGHSTRNRWRIH